MQIDLFRYHDLTARLASYSTDGGDLLRGDPDDLQIVGAEPLYANGEEERARIAGVVTLIGPRSTPDVDPSPTFGLVARGPALLILTSERVIAMFQRAGATQLGPIDDTEVHTYVLPWDLVDAISMPQRKSLADRIAGGRSIEIHSVLIPSVLAVVPRFREAEDGQTAKLADEKALALLVDCAVQHRLSVSEPPDQARLRRLLGGQVPVIGGELVANITDEATVGVPSHLAGRLVERP